MSEKLSLIHIFLMHAVKDLIRAGAAAALVKIDCMWTEDDLRFKRLGLPVAVGLSKDMCPDHYAIYLSLIHI